MAAALLARPRAELTARPPDDRWSALEYACHVRDVFRLYDQRLALMLTEDDPDLRQLGPGRTAVERPLQRAGPGDGGRRDRAAAAPLADRFDSVEGDQWQRTGNRSDGARFTVDTFARYFVHDPIHHLYDVARGFAALGVAAEATPGRWVTLAVDTALEPVGARRRRRGPRRPGRAALLRRPPCRPTGPSGARTAATSSFALRAPASPPGGPGRRASWPTSSGWPPSPRSTSTSPCCAPRVSPPRPGSGSTRATARSEALVWGLDPGGAALDQTSSRSRGARPTDCPPGTSGSPTFPRGRASGRPARSSTTSTSARSIGGPTGPLRARSTRPSPWWARFVPTARFADPWVDACRLLIPIDTMGWPAASQAHAYQEPLATVAVTVDLSVGFHRPADDEWLLAEATAPLAAGGLVAATGRVWDRSRGALLASGGQTMLCRPAPAPGRPGPLARRRPWSLCRRR